MTARSHWPSIAPHQFCLSAETDSTWFRFTMMYLITTNDIIYTEDMIDCIISTPF